MKFTKEEISLLQRYTQLVAPSGYERDVARNLINDMEQMDYPLIKDNLGSVYALKKSKNPKFKVMISAHMDEVGFMVKSITGLGLMKVMPLGGISLNNVTGNRLILKSQSGQAFEGTCYAKAKNPEKADDVLMDFGFASREDALSQGVKVGDTMVIKGEFAILNDGKRVLSKAIDDRYGIVLGLETLKEFKDIDLPFDLYVGGSVQEEVGLRGGETAANLIKPDLAILLDCSTATDIEGGDYGIGKGMVIRYLDSGMIGFPELLAFQEQCAKEAKVPSQLFTTGGCTEAARVHKVDSGILSLNHCIIGRAIHTGSTMIDAVDYHSAKKTLFVMLNKLNEQVFAGFLNERRG